MDILKKTFLLHVASLLIHTGNPNCYRGERTCCIGYYWNEKEQSCKECVLGHFGENCSKLCRYPSYGKGYQNKCTCPEILCVPALGCVEIEGMKKGSNITKRETTVISNSLTIGIAGVVVSLFLLIAAIILKTALKRKPEVKEENAIHHLQSNTTSAENNRSCYSQRMSNVYDIISEDIETYRDTKYTTKCLNAGKVTNKSENFGTTNEYLDTCTLPPGAQPIRGSSHFYSPL